MVTAIPRRICQRFLPECTFRGRQNKKLQYPVLAAAALRGGTDPDLLDEVAWWLTDDCRQANSSSQFNRRRLDATPLEGERGSRP